MTLTRMVLVELWGESLWIGPRKDGRRGMGYSVGNSLEEFCGKGRREVGWEVKEVRSRNIFYLFIYF